MGTRNRDRWLRAYGNLWTDSCCLHEPPWAPQQVTEVLCWLWSPFSDAWCSGPKEETDSESVSIVALDNGMFGMLLESEDYTGHGCQCMSEAILRGSLPELVSMVEEGPKRDAVSAALAAGSSAPAESSSRRMES